MEKKIFRGKFQIADFAIRFINSIIENCNSEDDMSKIAA
jgi:hypothetical protein